jgi:hypothetical protein
MSDPNDDLDDVLAPQPGKPSPALRESLLQITERRLARARRLRHGAKIAAFAAVFVVGGAVGWFARPERERERVIEVAGETRTLVVPILVPIAQTPVADPPGSPPLSGPQTELRAEQADDRIEAAKLYRAAGDTFLREQDYSNATRCYRLFLIRAGDSGLSLEADDSWLLTSLKNAAFKEKTNAPKTVD